MMVKIIKLGEILNNIQLDIVLDYLNKKDWKNLKEFLHSIDSSLKEKEILADYLYYYLKYQFENYNFIIDNGEKIR